MIQAASAQTLAIRLPTAFDDKDLPTFQARIAPGAVLQVPGRNPRLGDKHGLPTRLGFFAQAAYVMHCGDGLTLRVAGRGCPA